jgi:hypothetical protein
VPAIGGIEARFGEVTVIVTGSAKAPGGMLTVRLAPATATGPTVPPLVGMVTVVMTAVNPPSDAGLITAGGPYWLPAEVAASAVPAGAQTAAAVSTTIAKGLVLTTLFGRIWIGPFLLGGINSPGFIARGGWNPPVS